MKVIKLFPEYMIESIPELKDAIEEGKRRGYRVNEYFIIEPEDEAMLMGDIE